MAREELKEIPKAPTPRLWAIPTIRKEVKERVTTQQRVAQEVMLSTFKVFDSRIAESGNPELKQAWNASSLKTLLG